MDIDIEFESALEFMCFECEQGEEPPECLCFYEHDLMGESDTVRQGIAKLVQSGDLEYRNGEYRPNRTLIFEIEVRLNYEGK